MTWLYLIIRWLIWHMLCYMMSPHLLYCFLKCGLVTKMLFSAKSRNHRLSHNICTQISTSGLCLQNYGLLSSDILKRPQKCETISHWIWHLLSKRHIMWEIVSNFVAFLENLNFNSHDSNYSKTNVILSN